MINLNDIAEDLFNKIRSRYSNVKMGDENGKVTSEAELARFIDFEYKSNGEILGHVNVSLSEDDGLVVYYSSEFVSEENSEVQKDWYNFLKELRTFSKKRMLNFDTRDITKSNLDKRDYQFLATPSGDTPMSESKLYGSSRKSYQDLAGATMIVTHTKPVNAERAGARSMHIENIFIENTDGERFKYPLKHLNGARALGRHVANGGTPYDAFGSHIIEMSQELGKLRKFKTYMGRSGVMAEAMGPVADRVNDRISQIKKEVTMLQRESYYKDVIEGFEARELSEVPDDVKAEWVEALTIKSFKEELQDVFPYVYNLVAEAESLGPEDLGEGFWGRLTANSIEDWATEDMGQLTQASKDFMHLRQEYNGTEYEAQIECRIKSFENFVSVKERMPQGADGMPLTIEDPESWLQQNPNHKCANAGQQESYEDALESAISSVTKKYEVSEGNSVFSQDEQEADQSIKKLQSLIGDHFPAGVDGMNAVESLQGLIDDPMLNNMLRQLGEKDSDMCVRPLIQKYIKAKDASLLSKLDFGNMAEGERHGNSAIYKKCWKGYSRVPGTTAGEPGSCKKNEGNAYADAVRQAKKDGKKKGDKINGPDGDEITIEKDEKTPLGEFILSYFDRETGEFPKGETAVLTMVEKDYGRDKVGPAKQFISRLQQVVSEYAVEDESEEFSRIKKLAGL